MNSAEYTSWTKTSASFSRAQWLWTLALVIFILVAFYGKLDWSPVLIPSAILTWYGAIRVTSHANEGQ